MIRLARAEQSQFDSPGIGVHRRLAVLLQDGELAGQPLSGSTSACALSVSISTARFDSTIRWSAAAVARLMSEETWLWAVLIAASADSTSGGGSIPVISDASSRIP